jgi:hypothetical protein
MLRTLALFCALALAGCASWSEVDRFSTGGNTMPTEAERRERVSGATGLTPAQVDKFVKGKPWIGMPQNVLEEMMGGKATRSQRKLTTAGEDDVLFFHERVGDWKTGITSKYFQAKMRDGKLIEFMELDPHAGDLERWMKGTN